MNAAPNAKIVREISTVFDAIRSPTPRHSLVRLGLIAFASLLASCGGSGEKAADDAPAAETIRAESKDVFTPAWSTNAAPPPEAGGIREIGSILDAMPFGTLGAPTPEKPKAKSGPIDPSASNWTIAISVFRGDNHYEDAGKALARVRSEGGLPDAYLQRRGPATSIAHGRYSGPSDPRAQSDLTRIQGIHAGGTPVYGGAYLCPPYQGTATANLPEYDLRRAKQTHGSNVIYTLQVGWYGREDLPRATEADLKEARKAAEEAVERLRREGELAFFYHGPNRSMVTVGAFDSTDFDSQKPGVESARLREARRRHPLSLYNGAGYSYKSPGMREAKLLSSCLVVIPTK